ncbi:hypothetical protein E2C01_026597 [Portunus trituberculatus]|uniref:Uncharacterized protein n=1 Tax=Portunus trituberculatus TaxID=210409 RepID=A0A5B7EJL6_PORTR|nr:hypothetical protein [Portunus trituberculatus]
MQLRNISVRPDSAAIPATGSNFPGLPLYASLLHSSRPLPALAAHLSLFTIHGAPGKTSSAISDLEPHHCTSLCPALLQERNRFVWYGETGTTVHSTSFVPTVSISE